MTFPVVQSRATGRSTTTDTTTHAITMPAGIVAGDLLVAVFSVDGDAVCTAPVGWRAMGQLSYSIDQVTQAVFVRNATGTGADTLTVTTSIAQQSSHIVLRVSGTTGPAGVSCTFFGGSSTNSNPPVNTVGSAADYLWITTRSGDSTVVATAVPAGYGNWQSIAAAGSNGASTDTAELNFNGTTQDPGTWTSPSEQWVSSTITVTPGVVVPTVAKFGSAQFDVVALPPSPKMRFSSVQMDVAIVTGVTAARVAGLQVDVASTPSPQVRLGGLQTDVAYVYAGPYGRVGGLHVDVAYFPAPAVPSGPTVSVWNGTLEIAATATVWNGTAEIATTLEVAP